MLFNNRRGRIRDHVESKAKIISKAIAPIKGASAMETSSSNINASSFRIYCKTEEVVDRVENTLRGLAIQRLHTNTIQGTGRGIVVCVTIITDLIR